MPLGASWPGWQEALRLMVVPSVWQTALAAVGLHATHRAGWLRVALIGLVSVAVFFVVCLAFMRPGLISPEAR